MKINKVNNSIKIYLEEIDKLNKKYNIEPPSDIREYILIPSPKENWLFYNLFKRM
jgi:hypothetical protein